VLDVSDIARLEVSPWCSLDTVATAVLEVVSVRSE
jgi:hypothetical protein